MNPRQVKRLNTGRVHRWGQTALFLAAAVTVSFALNGCGEGESTQPATTTAAPTTTPSPTTTAEPTESVDDGIDPETGLPYGVLYWDTAVDLGIEDTIDWGARCDTETGQLALPWFFRSNCMAPFEGDNGGATDRG